MSSKVDKKIWLIFTIILTACNVIAVQTVEVIEIVTTKEILTQLTTASETATPEPKNYSEQEQQFITIEALNQGAIMLVQYYTLLDYGLYEEAYQLLSSSKQQRSLDDYIEMMEMAFVNVEIISVQPYKDHHPANSVDERILYHVQIIAEGEGGMSGSIPNGVLQNLFITVINENNEWKIYSFATLPTRQ